MNDWNIKHFLGIVFLIQAAVLLVLGLEYCGYHLMPVRQVVLFAYLTFIPGMLVLRALDIHKQGSAITAVYAVGLSLVTLMFTGAFLNMFLPLAGYTQPITLFPLTVALALVVLTLSIVCLVRDRGHDIDTSVELSAVLAPKALLLMLVPFLAVFGTYLMNNYTDNILLLAMIVAICVIVLLVGFTRLIPEELFSLAILVIAASLLLHNSLISDSLVGWDVHYEKTIADNVVNGGLWNISINNVLNAMLSIVMLAPIYSIFLDMGVVWVYKIVFPLLFALVPVVLYQAYRKQSDDRLGFMAAFFFMGLVVFFSEMLQLARQEIAELFLSLAILLIVDRSMEKTRWTALFLLFAVGLVISHYGLTFIFLGTITLAWAFTFVVSMVRKDGQPDLNRRLGPALIIGLAAFCAIWYMYTAASNPFHTVVDLAGRIEKPIEAMAMDLLTPGNAALPSITTEPLKMIETGGSASTLHRTFLYLLVATQGLLVLGVITAIYVKGTVKIRREYYALALVNLLMLVISLVLPNFATALNTTRLYQIALIILAPFFVLGFVNIFTALGWLTRSSAKGTRAVAIGALSVFLVLYLIFNTGLIFEVTKDVPMSYSLDRTGDNQSYTIYNSLEVAGARWTMDARDTVARNLTWVPPIFSDIYRWLLLQDWNTSRSYQLPDAMETVPQSSYIYLGTYNVLNGQSIQIKWIPARTTSVANLSGITDNRNRIYANGGSEVYI